MFTYGCISSLAALGGDWLHMRSLRVCRFCFKQMLRKHFFLNLSRMQQLMQQLLTEQGFDVPDGDLLSPIKTIMQISEDDRDDRYAKAKICIETLKEALDLDCEDQDDEYGSIFLICRKALKRYLMGLARKI